MRRIPQLDGLRGIAILMVFAAHALRVPMLPKRAKADSFGHRAEIGKVGLGLDIAYFNGTVLLQDQF
jgi:peptidoglycan/LPS O-acetylase OafA/YrhL